MHDTLLGSNDGGIPCPATCDDTCVDLSTDESNCGACGAACATGEVCVQRQCLTSCPSYLAECDGRCVDTKHDPGACGGCGVVCGAGRACVDGHCAGDAGSPDAGLDAGASVDSGSPDSGGRALFSSQTVLGTDAGSFRVGYGLAVDGQGRIVLGGTSLVAATHGAFLGRLHGDGTVDPTFGDGGFLLLPGRTPAASTFLVDVGIDSAGRILAAGYSMGGVPSSIAVWRLDAEGTPDLSFGEQGVFFMSGTSGGKLDWLRALAIDTQRRPVIVGASEDDAGVSRFSAWRLTP